MTRYYLSNTATSPSPTDPNAYSNTPTGAGNFTKYTPGKLLQTNPASAASATMTGITNNQTRSFLWVTEPGDPNLTTFSALSFHVVLKITDVSGSGGGGTAGFLVNARILRLDSNNEVQTPIGGNAGGVSVQETDTFPRTITLICAPTSFGAGNASDRLGLQVFCQENGNETTSDITIEVQTDASYVLNGEGVLLQRCAQGWDQYNADTTNYNIQGKYTTYRAGSSAGTNSWGGVAGTFETPGLLSSEKHVKRPDTVGPNYGDVSPDDLTPNGGVYTFRFMFDADAATENIAYFATNAPNNKEIRLKTDGSSKLQVEITNTSTTYTATTLALATDTLYLCEFGIVFDDTDGGFWVKINGVDVDGLVEPDGLSTCISGQRPALAAHTNTTAADLLHDDQVIDWRLGALSEEAFLTFGGRVPRVSTLFVAGDGNYNTGWDKLTGGFGGTADNTYANKWEQLKEESYDKLDHFLGITNSKNKISYVHEALGQPGATIKTVVQKHAVGTVQDGNAIFVPFLRIGGSDYIHPYFDDYDSGGDDYLLNVTCTTGTDFAEMTVGWLLNPATGVEWTNDDLAALEAGGYFTVHNDSTTAAQGVLMITQAVLVVVWLEPLAQAGDFLWTLPILGVGW